MPVAAVVVKDDSIALLCTHVLRSLICEDHVSVLEFVVAENLHALRRLEVNAVHRQIFGSRIHGLAFDVAVDRVGEVLQDHFLMLGKIRGEPARVLGSHRQHEIRVASEFAVKVRDKVLLGNTEVETEHRDEAAHEYREDHEKCSKRLPEDIFKCRFKNYIHCRSPPSVPSADTVLGRDIHAVALLHAVRLVESIKRRKYRINPDDRRAVRIRIKLVYDSRIELLAAPYRRVILEKQLELLLGMRKRRDALKRTQVGVILTQCLLAVDVVNAEDREVVLEVGDRLLITGIQSREVIIADPRRVIVAVLVKHDAGAVERVTHLVTDYHAEAAQIRVVVLIGREKRLDRDSRSDRDVVKRLVVAGI